MRSRIAHWLPTVWRYALAVLIVSAVVVVKWDLVPALGRDAPFLLMLASILVPAWYAGVGPGLLAAALSVVAVVYLAPAGPALSRVQTVVFGTEAGVAVAITAAVRSSRRRTEALTHRLERLHATNMALASARTVQDAAEATLHEVATFGAAAVWIYLLADRGGPLRLLAHRGRGELDLRDRFKEIGLDRMLPSALAARTRSGVFVESEAELRTRFPELAAGASGGAFAATMFCAPMLVHQGVVGVLGVSFSEARRFSAGERAWAQALAQDCGMAVERTRAFEMEQRARTEAEEASRVKEEFLAMASHELRTPLTSIVGWAHLLKKRADNVRDGGADELSHGLDVIERSALAESRLVNDLLDMTRVVAHRLSIEAKVLDLSEIVRAAAEELQVVAHGRGIHFDIASFPQATVVGDAGRLRQVVYNVTSNALKFTPPGGHVRLELQAHDHRARVVVRDDGAGIDGDELLHVFDPFRPVRHAESAATRDGGGLGLGLAIARHIVQEHRGRIGVDSAGLGRGTTVTIELPLAKAVAGAFEPSREPGAGADGMRLAGLRVLVVEDDPDVRTVLGEVLASEGAQIEQASSARAALESVGRSAPNVIVSAIAMPGENGLWLLRNVRAGTGRAAAVPAIALTDSSRPNSAGDAQAAGYQLHMLRPPEPRALIDAVANLGGKG